MAPPPRIPKAATLGDAAADEIARDAARAARARDHWQLVLGTLQADPFGAGDPEAFKVLRAIPDVVFDDHRDPEIGRTHILAPRDHVPAGGLVNRSGCGVSGAEIARFLGAGNGIDDVLASVRALEAAAKGAPARRAPGRSVRACRELHDAVRRLDTARLSATPNRVTRAEALALHRQEGAFAVTPDARSYAHAPLTATAAGTCRIPDVLFASEDIAEPTRPGFNLVFRMPRITEAEAAQDPDLMRMGALLVNAVVLGGLDIVASDRAAPDAPGDELRALVAAALAAGGPLGKDSTARRYADVGPVWMRFVTAVAMIELETRPRLPDDLEEYFEAVRRRLSAMVAAHNTELRAQGAGGVDVMLHGDEARDVRQVLRLQADWYGSRTDPDTLRPWVGRSMTVSPRPGFSPFVSYLRFNLGDRSFVTTILRTAEKLRDIEKRWQRRDADRWPGELLDRLREAGGSPALGGKSPLERARREWEDLGQPDQHAWKAAGIIARLREAGSTYPAWAPAAAPSDAVTHVGVARVAQRALDDLALRNLLPAIGAALEWTPLDDLSNLGVPTDRRAFSRAHSFARLRLVYGRALAAAGVPPDPRPW